VEARIKVHIADGVPPSLLKKNKFLGKRLVSKFGMQYGINNLGSHKISPLQNRALLAIITVIWGF
jgi:hypothetical protein